MAENTENKGSKNEVDEQKLAGIFKNFWRDYGKDKEVEEWKSCKGGTEVIDYLKDPNKQPGAILRGCEEFHYCRNKYDQSNEKKSGEGNSDFQYDESRVPWQRLLDDGYINWCVSVFTWPEEWLSNANQQGRHIVKENWKHLDAYKRINKLAEKHLGISDEKKDGKEENKKPENEEEEIKKEDEEKPAEQTTPKEQNVEPEETVTVEVVTTPTTPLFLEVKDREQNQGGALLPPESPSTTGEVEGEKSPTESPSTSGKEEGENSLDSKVNE